MVVLTSTDLPSKLGNHYLVALGSQKIGNLHALSPVQFKLFGFFKGV